MTRSNKSARKCTLFRKSSTFSLNVQCSPETWIDPGFWMCLSMYNVGNTPAQDILCLLHHVVPFCQTKLHLLPAKFHASPGAIKNGKATRVKCSKWVKASRLMHCQLLAAVHPRGATYREFVFGIGRPSEQFCCCEAPIDTTLLSLGTRWTTPFRPPSILGACQRLTGVAQPSGKRGRDAAQGKRTWHFSDREYISHPYLVYYS